VIEIRIVESWKGVRKVGEGIPYFLKSLIFSSSGTNPTGDRPATVRVCVGGYKVRVQGSKSKDGKYPVCGSRAERITDKGRIEELTGIMSVWA
jgi:hypothetical protein